MCACVYVTLNKGYGMFAHKMLFNNPNLEIIHENWEGFFF